jgi:two-component system, NarL family, nitrate/nitrite response regulator NarL
LNKHSKIKVAIVDDHELMRRGLRETISEFPEFEIVGEGENSDQAIELAFSKKPDIMLLDVNMPGDGITTVKLMKNLEQPPKIIILTVYDNLENVRAAMTNGAYGYVLKGIAGDELISVMRLVNEGKKHVGPELAAKLMTQADDVEKSNFAPRDDAQFATLTEREMQILLLIGKGANNSAISKQLNLSEATVKHYTTQMFRKLSVKNRTEAALKVAVRLP